MIYLLSCFFRDLAVGSDKSMAEIMAAKLKALGRPALVQLRDAALDLVRVAELAIQAEDDKWCEYHNSVRVDTKPCRFCENESGELPPVRASFSEGPQS